MSLAWPSATAAAVDSTSRAVRPAVLRRSLTPARMLLASSARASSDSAICWSAVAATPPTAPKDLQASKRSGRRPRDGRESGSGRCSRNGYVSRVAKLLKNNCVRMVHLFRY
eukprot:scaffold395_cov243-Pinguiococcus_pyrenoidosus.AAC.43